MKGGEYVGVEDNVSDRRYFPVDWRGSSEAADE